jgi:hypothetical protein
LVSNVVKSWHDDRRSVIRGIDKAGRKVLTARRCPNEEDIERRFFPSLAQFEAIAWGRRLEQIAI